MTQYTGTVDTSPSGDTNAAAWAKFNQLAAAFYTMQTGATAPSSPQAGMLWRDTATTTVKMYDGAAWVIQIANYSLAGGGTILRDGTVAFTGDQSMGTHKITNVTAGASSGDAVNKGQVDAQNRVSCVPFTFANATKDYFAFMGCANVTLVSIKLVVSTGTAGSGAGTRWDFQLTNLGTGGGGATTILTAAKTTNGSEITASASYDLGAIANAAVAAGETLKLSITKTGSPTDLSAATWCALVIAYKVSV